VMERGIYLEARRALRVCSSVRQTTDLCRVRLFLKTYKHQIKRAVSVKTYGFLLYDIAE